ncbi:MAG: YbjN domain-containing protein, partial [Anaerolineae bacterium]|nr:YbjN domain-containing protein [Anaerolineae bacterium]
RPAVAEFLTRANFGLRIGNFELDYHDGEVRYKTSLDFEDEKLTPALIRNAVYPAVTTMDRYLPGLMKVVYGGRTPYEAIEEIEAESEP